MKLLPLLLAIGCWHTGSNDCCITSSELVTIQAGCSLEQLTKSIGQHAGIVEELPYFDSKKRAATGRPDVDHEFRVLLDSGVVVTCVRSSVWSKVDHRLPTTPYYFIFEDDSLVGILERPIPPGERVEIDGQPVFRHVIDPAHYIPAVLSSGRIPFALFSAVAADRANRSFGTRDERGAVIVTSPKAAEESRQIREDFERRLLGELERLRLKYDPWLIAIGMSADEVKATFAARPYRVVEIEDESPSQVLVFGESLDTLGGVMRQRDLPWVAVRIRDATVIAVYSNGVLDRRWVE